VGGGGRGWWGKGGGKRERRERREGGKREREREGGGSALAAISLSTRRRSPVLPLSNVLKQLFLKGQKETCSAALRCTRRPFSIFFFFFTER
jgi:hypothetical protein